MNENESEQHILIINIYYKLLLKSGKNIDVTRQELNKYDYKIYMTTEDNLNIFICCKEVEK